MAEPISSTIAGEDRAAWLPTAAAALGRILAAIESASSEICFEFYIFRAGPPGDAFRAALAAAAGRGVVVRVLLDAFGSGGLTADYWRSLTDAGGEVALFNPASVLRISIRNHRKLVVVDRRIAFLGGFNIGPEYEGDGISHGWRDLGIELEGAAIPPLLSSFRVMWGHRDFTQARFFRWRHPPWRRRRQEAKVEVLPNGPGFGRNSFDRSLLQALRRGRDISIVAAYFMPSPHLRRELMRAARHGAKVRLLLAGMTDVPLIQAAGRRSYLRMLAAGIEIAEYEPQILHAKLALIDDIVYAGSANLDARSLDLNYEIVVRVVDPALAAAGRKIFARDWALSRLIQRNSWKEFWTLGRRLHGLAAVLLLTRIDPWLAHRQMRSLN